MSSVLKINTSHGILFKNLIHIIQQNFKDIMCLKITSSGIMCDMQNSDSTKLVKFNIDAQCLEHYHLKGPEFYIGVNIEHFVLAFKTIKKKDSIELEITPSKLTLVVSSADRRNTMVNKIDVSAVQQLEFDEISGYTTSQCIAACDFVKMTKELGSICSEITIEKYDLSTKFIAENMDQISKTIQIGRVENSDQEPKLKFNIPTNYLADLKLNLISSQIQLFMEKDLPLYIHCNIMDIGKFNFYIKIGEQ